MAIYCRIGVRVNLLSARLVPVWVEHKPYETKWHYSEPKKVGKRSKVDLLHIWHATAEYAEMSRDGSCKPGMILWNGNEDPEVSFVADGGLKEIRDEFYRLNPIDAAREMYGVAA
jgi:hypothetical protein